MKNELNINDLIAHVRVAEAGQLAESIGPLSNPAAVLQRLMHYSEHPATEVPDASV